MPYYELPPAGSDGTFSNHPLYQLVARDAQSALTPNETQRTTLIVAGCYVIAIAILWYVVVCLAGDEAN